MRGVISNDSPAYSVLNSSPLSVSPLDNVGDLRIILSETLMAWRGGRGALEVSDKMPSWTEFYQSLEKPPQKGFVCFPCCCWWLNLTRRPLESLCLGGKGALGLVMGTELPSLRNYGDATPPRHGLLPPLQSNAARQPLCSLRKIYKQINPAFFAVWSFGTGIK